jgi:hypothetical protein
VVTPVGHNQVPLPSVKDTMTVVPPFLANMPKARADKPPRVAINGIYLNCVCAANKMYVLAAVLIAV